MYEVFTDFTVLPVFTGENLRNLPVKTVKGFPVK